MNLSDKQKGIALSLIGVLLITPDSLLIRLIDIPSWELLFYRGLIPFRIAIESSISGSLISIFWNLLDNAWF